LGRGTRDRPHHQAEPYGAEESIRSADLHDPEYIRKSAGL